MPPRFLGFLALLTAVAPTLAEAQPFRRPGVGIRITASGKYETDKVMENLGRYTLLKEPDIQSELRLTDEQRTQLAAAAETLRSTSSLPRPAAGELPATPEDRAKALEAFRQQRSQTPEQREKALEERNRQLEETFAVLSTEQRSRLEQIFLQEQGAPFLLKSELADAIQLTHAQSATLKTLYREMIQASLSIPRGARPATDLSREERLAEIQKRAGDTSKRLAESERLREKFDNDVCSMLTDEQRAAWDKLLGPKFAFRSRSDSPAGTAPDAPKP